MFNKLSIVLVLGLMLFSCRVSLVPSASPQISSLIDRIGDNAASMYNDIRYSTDKGYNTYLPKYDFINSEIDSLIVLDNARGKAKEMIKQDAAIKKHFNIYKDEHQAYGNITNGKVNVYDVYFKSYVDARKVSEKSLK